MPPLHMGRGSLTLGGFAAFLIPKSEMTWRRAGLGSPVGMSSRPSDLSRRSP